MADQNKVIVPGRVQKDSNSNRRFKIKKDKTSEYDVDIEIAEDGDYAVDKLSVDGLPEKMNDGTGIRWLNNFAVKKNGQYINQKYKVTIVGLAVSMGNSRLVIFDGNGDPYYYTGAIINDTFELTDGDPAIGNSP